MTDHVFLDRLTPLAFTTSVSGVHLFKIQGRTKKPMDSGPVHADLLQMKISSGLA